MSYSVSNQKPNLPESQIECAILLAVNFLQTKITIMRSSHIADVNAVIGLAFEEGRIVASKMDSRPRLMCMRTISYSDMFREEFCKNFNIEDLPINDIIESFTMGLRFPL